MKKLPLLLVILSIMVLGSLFIWAADNEDSVLGGGRRISTSEIELFSLATSTDSTVIPTNVGSFRHIGITVVSESASGTLKFACSNSDDAPDFEATQSATNRWDFIEVVDKEDGALIDGDDGIVMANSTDVRQFEVNDNFSTWCTAKLSNVTGSGTTTVHFKSSQN